MTTWLGISMENTVLLTIWTPLLYPAFYWLMDKEKNRPPEATTHQDIQYSPLDSSSSGRQHQLTLKQKAQLVWYNMPLALSIYSNYMAKFLLPQAILTTVVFPNSGFSPRDHYQYYLFTLVFSECLGKSYGLVAHLLNCGLPQYTKHTWIFSSFNVVTLIVLVCESWFRFLHHVEIVIVMCFVVGVLVGLVYDFTFAAAHGEPKSPSREFSRAVLVSPISTGSSFASLLGLYIEPVLREHCVYAIGNVTECWAREMQK